MENDDVLQNVKPTGPKEVGRVILEDREIEVACFVVRLVNKALQNITDNDGSFDVKVDISKLPQIENEERLLRYLENVYENAGWEEVQASYDGENGEDDNYIKVEFTFSAKIRQEM